MVTEAYVAIGRAVEVLDQVEVRKLNEAALLLDQAGAHELAQAIYETASGVAAARRTLGRSLAGRRADEPA